MAQQEKGLTCWSGGRQADPLDGLLFEETSTSAAASRLGGQTRDAVTRAAAAIGLRHGPIHAECRVSVAADGRATVFVLEVAGRPIGGLCARALRFTSIQDQETVVPLEELLLKHALGEDPSAYQRESSASGVMMIPIPRRGIFRSVDGVDAARREPHVDDVRITAKPDQLLVPLPEGASYLGFIFARAAQARDVDRALRAAHARLTFQIDPELLVLAPGQIHYNLQHG